ncbi:hypothetical protein 010DV004_212 [Bacillus phage 010DV004]|nr:hypothetical protein 010DV004_212 [Bacillus phage 010DV004]QZA69426.1 hypothetical protein 010DV005_212 [Bacillus phage 010DV005]QZA69995.1 hypothetical protein 043JT007_212 [Bacillus phage 043JT007]
MQKEAIYVFNYNGQTVNVDAYVDPVEKRRYYGPVGNPYRDSVNYRGTGVTETQTIVAELVSDIFIPDAPAYSQNTHSLIFYLPDVDAYAAGNYFELNEGDSGVPSPDFTVRMLDKI